MIHKPSLSLLRVKPGTLSNLLSPQRSYMGANPTQAYGVLAFLLAFLAIAGCFASGGNIVLVVVAIVLLAVAALISLKCKSWENTED